MFILQSNQLYRLNVHLEVGGQLRRIVMCLVYASVGLAIAMFVSGEHWLADRGRFIVLLFLGFSVPLLSVERILIMRPLFSLLVKFRLSRRKVLVIGACGDGTKVLNVFGTNNAKACHSSVFWMTASGGEDLFPGGARVLGRIADVERMVKDDRSRRNPPLHRRP